MKDKATLQYIISVDYRIKCWGDQCVAFHLPTGKTQLLHSLPALIVYTIWQHSHISFAQLAAKLLENEMGEKFSSAIIDTYLRQLKISNIIQST